MTNFNPNDVTFPELKDGDHWSVVEGEVIWNSLVVSIVRVNRNPKTYGFWAKLFGKRDEPSGYILHSDRVSIHINTGTVQAIVDQLYFKYKLTNGR